MDTNGTIPSNASGSGQPKKYIRTFAGDMEILKGGGVPDLEPFAEPTPDIASVPDIAPLTPPAPPSPPEMPVSPQPSELKASAFVPGLDVSLAQKPSPLAPPLETYATDFLERMKDTGATTATVLAAQEDASGVPEEQPQKKVSGASILYILSSIFLIGIGGAGAYFAYEHYVTAHAPVALTPTIEAPIFVDDREQIPVEGDTLLQSIEESVSGEPLQPGTVRLLYLSGGTTTESVFSALQFPAPGILLRNVIANGSMAGVVNVGGVQSPFFILSVSSYSDTFAGMLSWENTMTNDLTALFPPYEPPVVASTTAATTTPIVATSTTATSTAKTKTLAPKVPAKTATSTVATTTPVIARTPGFDDEVVDNHNVRVYRDANDQSVLLYGYWNQTTLVIARDSAAFTEILNRLGTSHT